MQDGCKVYMDSSMASIGTCFMVSWIIFENNLLDVGLTQNWKTMALQMLTTVGLFCIIMCEDLHEYRFIETIWLMARVIYDFTLCLRIRDHTT